MAYHDDSLAGKGAFGDVLSVLGIRWGREGFSSEASRTLFSRSTVDGFGDSEHQSGVQKLRVEAGIAKEGGERLITPSLMTTVGSRKVVDVAVDTSLILAVCFDGKFLGANAQGVEFCNKTGTEQQVEVGMLAFSSASTCGNDSVFAGEGFRETTTGDMGAFVQRGKVAPEFRDVSACD